MSGTTEIRAALITQVTAAGGANITASRIAWENKSFLPGSARWYRVTFLPGSYRAAAIGVGSQNRHVGILQIDIFDPPNKGDAVTQTEAERIAAAFKRGTILTYSGVSVRCERAYRGSGDSSDPSWFHVPVKIEWRADVAN